MPEEQVNKVTVRGFLVEESFGNIPLIAKNYSIMAMSTIQ